MKYLLPCECGNATPVETSQAGQQISCECGATLEVPTLRGVRELEPAEEATPPTRTSTEWDASRGVAFAGSLVLLVIGAAVSYFGYAGLLATPDVSREFELASSGQIVDDMSLEDTYDVWKHVRDHGLGPRGQNAYVNLRIFRAGRQRVLTIGIVLCVAGVVGASGAILFRKKPTQ